MFQLGQMKVASAVVRLSIVGRSVGEARRAFRVLMGDFDDVELGWLVMRLLSASMGLEWDEPPEGSSW